MADEELIAALERERDAYVQAGKDDRAKQVDAELKRLTGVRKAKKETTVPEGKEQT